jgi:hypothetical protein
MTIFAVLMSGEQPMLVNAIKSKFPSDHLEVTATQWFVSSAGTVVELVAVLGIYDAAKPQEPPTGSAIVLAMSAYYGRASANVWDWFKAKLETSP